MYVFKKVLLSVMLHAALTPSTNMNIQKVTLLAMKVASSDDLYTFENKVYSILRIENRNCCPLFHSMPYKSFKMNLLRYFASDLKDWFTATRVYPCNGYCIYFDPITHTINIQAIDPIIIASEQCDNTQEPQDSEHEQVPIDEDNELECRWPLHEGVSNQEEEDIDIAAIAAFRPIADTAVSIFEGRRAAEAAAFQCAARAAATVRAAEAEASRRAFKAATAAANAARKANAGDTSSSNTIQPEENLHSLPVMSRPLIPISIISRPPIPVPTATKLPLQPVTFRPLAFPARLQKRSRGRPRKSEQLPPVTMNMQFTHHTRWLPNNSTNPYNTPTVSQNVLWSVTPETQPVQNSAADTCSPSKRRKEERHEDSPTESKHATQPSDPTTPDMSSEPRSERT